MPRTDFPASDRTHQPKILFNRPDASRPTWRRSSCFAVKDVVGPDDALDQGVAHHVPGIEEGEADAIHVTQDLDGLAQARGLSARQVYLGDVAGDHRGGAEADAGKEHLHLLRRGVLGLVQMMKASFRVRPRM